MPQNLDAERSVLGAILLDNHALSAAIEKLKPEDFFLPQHRLIFNRMIELGKAQQAIDLVTVSDRLYHTGDLEAAGGSSYLAQLSDGVPRVTHLEHYARIIKEKAVLRRLIHETRAIQQNAFEESENPGALLANAAEQLANIMAASVLPGEDFRKMFHDFADFENSSALTFAIDGFLQNDAATMIGGLSGHGKTFVLLSIVKALLAGKGAKLWDTFEVKETATSCVYLIPESSIGPFKHRLKQLALYDHLRPEDGRLLVRTLSKGPTPCLSDPRILFAAKGAHVFLDTAVRFSAEGDENSAGDNQRGLAADIFALLASGARSVVGAHHAPKPFAKENVMRLENVLRGSGDIGAMLATCWAVKQLDPARNIIHVENVKPRDFAPCGPFQLVGRPYIDTEGDFRIHKRPGDCGSLQEEQDPDRDQGGASPEQREQRERRIEMLRGWLSKIPGLNRKDIVTWFAKEGIKITTETAKKYLVAAREGRV